VRTAYEAKAMSGEQASGRAAGDGQQGTRQYVKFTFYKVDASWRRTTPEERARGRDELVRAVEDAGARMLVRSYSLTGIRGDADFMLWQVSDGLEEVQRLATAVYSTAMGPYLSEPYAYLAMTRRSIYRTPEGSGEADARLRVQPGGSKYLFVYPFVKTRAWYELPKDVRQEMMNDHITIGRKYPSVKLNTTYSYGIDDQEFVVSFETDSPSDFLDLVMELRETKSSSYTLRDTPAFTCVAMPLADALEALGAPGAARALAGERGAWTPVAKVSELPEGASKAVYAAGEQVALFNAGGQIYAIGNRCSHANGPLADGEVAGTTVTCPWHSSQFDLETGGPLRAPAQRPVPVYDVRIEDGVILLAQRATAAS
jgi:chlorite dismutase